MHIIIVECCGGGGGLVVDGGSIRGYFVVGLHWWLFQRSYHDPLVITLLVMHFFTCFAINYPPGQCLNQNKCTFIFMPFLFGHFPRSINYSK